MLRTLLSVIILLVASPAAAQPDMIFRLSGVEDVTGLQREMEEARRKVRAWWGATFEEKITVEASRDIRISMALVPAWRGDRGQMQFGARTVNQRQPATIHEMIHVYAPNANRFLAEGLATYGHQHLGGNPAHPNMGRDLHELARPHANKVVMLVLERVATPQPVDEVNREAYVLGGSFVRFLVERHGMEKFRQIYALTPLRARQRDAGDVARWEEVYGDTYERLVDAWLAALRG